MFAVGTEVEGGDQGDARGVGDSGEVEVDEREGHKGALWTCHGRGGEGGWVCQFGERERDTNERTKIAEAFRRDRIGFARTLWNCCRSYT